MPFNKEDAIWKYERLSLSYALTGTITPETREDYEAAKQWLIRQVAEYQKARPEFEPRLEYDDPNATIYSGYALREFSALFDGLKDVVSINLKDDALRDAETIGPGEFGASTCIPRKEEIEFVIGARVNLQQLPYIPSDKAQNQILKQKLLESDKPYSVVSTLHKNGAPFVWIGEQHDEMLGKLLVIQSLPHIRKNNGVLLMEHYFHDVQQQMLDDWILHSPKDKPMPLELEIYTKSLDEEFHTRPPIQFMNVLKKAKQEGVRIVAIDTEQSRSILANIGSLDTSRLNAMNWTAYDILEKEYPGEKPFCVGLVGSAHINTYNNVPGLANVIGGIGVMTADQKTRRLLDNSHEMDIVLWGDEFAQVGISESKIVRLATLMPEHIDIAKKGANLFLRIPLDTVPVEQRQELIELLNTAIPGANFSAREGTDLHKGGRIPVADSITVPSNTAKTWQERLTELVKQGQGGRQ